MTKKTDLFLQRICCGEWIMSPNAENRHHTIFITAGIKRTCPDKHIHPIIQLLSVRIILLAFFCFLFTAARSQKGAAYLRVRVPVQYAWYTVNVTTGAAELRGEKKNHSINAGAAIGYEYFLGKRLSVEPGIGISTVSFRIVRPFDRRFWGDLQRPLRVTYPKYSYSLLQFPVRINYCLGTDKKLQYFIGLSNSLGFTFRQRYSDDSRLHKWYLFSDAVELNARFQFSAGGKLVVSVEPSVQLYNQWKKDLVLSDYGTDVFEIPGNQPHYNKQFFDAVGVAFSAAYRF